MLYSFIFEFEDPEDDVPELVEPDDDDEDGDPEDGYMGFYYN